MACPVASLVALGALFPPARTLFADDRKGRWIAWSSLALIAGGWLAYFLVWRQLPVRIAMEVISVAMLVGAGLRLRVLARRDGNAEKWKRAFRDGSRYATQLVRSPWVLTAKAVLLTMLGLEWVRWVHFSTLEYALAVVALVALVGVRIVQLQRTPRFATLESLATRPVEGTCPLGFDSPARPAPAHSFEEHPYRGTRGFTATEVARS